MRFGTIADGRYGGDLRSIDQVRNYLRRLDGGSRFFAFLVHPVPDDFDIAIDNPLDHSDENIQCAGSKSGMVVELRRREGDSFRQYALGGPGVPPLKSTVTVRWGDHSTDAFAHEVFDADQAIHLFEHYVANEGTLPDDVPMRELHLD